MKTSTKTITGAGRSGDNDWHIWIIFAPLMTSAWFTLVFRKNVPVYPSIKIQFNPTLCNKLDWEFAMPKHEIYATLRGSSN